MKIVQIIPNFGMGGAEIMCESLTYELIHQGHKVIVVSMYELHTIISDRLESNNVDIRYLGKRQGLDFTMYRKLIKLFREEKPNVIHTHLYAIKYAVPAAICAGIKKRIHTLHSIATQESSRIGKILNYFFFHLGKVVPVALNDEVQATTAEVYKLDLASIPIVWNGIDLNRCIIKTDYKTEGVTKILHIGRFMDVKNHRGLIRSFRKLRENNSNCELYLIGDGPMREEIEDVVKKENQENVVHFLGLIDNVYKYLHDADVFVLPSLYEGMPMTLIEAMGTGLPIVATRVGGVPNMLSSGENAILTEISEEEISDALLKLSFDASMRKQLGENARKSAEEFSAESMAKKYVNLYVKE